jgi:hypothetical protein
MNPTLQVSQNADKIRERFHSLLTRVNKENPRPADIEDLKDLLYNNQQRDGTVESRDRDGRTS